MREIAADVERWPVGAKLAIAESGELAGSVSGGCVEADVAAQANDVLAGGAPRLVTYGIADDVAFDIGLPCGGEIDVFVAEPAREVLGQLLAFSDREERAVHLVVVAGEPLGAELVATADGSRIGNGSSALAALADSALDGRTRLL